MILQVQDIIKDAMGLCGAIAADEAPSISEYALGIRTANVMIDRWASQRLLLRSTSPLSVPLTAGVNSYTVGLSGCAVTAPKPLNIRSGFVRDTGNNDNTIDVIDLISYNNLGDKEVSSGQPAYIAYDPGDAQQTVQKGTIYVYPPPSDGYTLKLEVDNYLTEFVAIADNVTFEPAYYEALIYNLAVRLWRYYRDGATPIPQDIVLIAHDALNNIRNINAQVFTAGMELPGKVAKYNIYTDN